jgi:ubiquinone/menaquinone biosynthesis C-methylase UbiE
MQSREVGEYWEANAAAWTEQVRSGFDVYRDLVNTPAFLSMLPNVKGLSGLDIGCGEGANTRELARLGASMIGIDISPTFIKHASECPDGPAIDYRVGDGTRLKFSDASFDFTTAFMSLMDMPDQEKALAEAFRVTKPAGFLQFSILHPCFVPSRRRTIRDERGVVTGVLISDYFTETNGDVERWHFSTLTEEQRNAISAFAVPRFHRTLATWVGYLCKAGWVIEELCEPRATPEIAEINEIVADTLVTPIFLIVRARKIWASLQQVREEEKLYPAL